MTKKSGNILIVDDDEDVLYSARLLLKPFYPIVHIEKNPDVIPNLLANNSYDVILLDMNFSGDANGGKQGFYWLKKILEFDPSMVVILITAYGNIEMAVKAIKEGATDFVIKPWQNEKLIATISSAMKLSNSNKEINSLLSRQKLLTDDLDKNFHNIIGSSEAIRSIFNIIQKVSKTDANVLILGENGTGKELVARAIHRNSNRSDEIFLTVDMGAISESLFESELFGYMKGSFTDAKEDRAGRFEVASGGTLFLDEISNITLNFQSKLLNVLQNRVVTRIGSSIPKPVDFRLICATNASIADLSQEKQFRQDLLYRINTVEIKLPPLRERSEDIPLLCDHFLNIYSKKYNKGSISLSSSVLSKLSTYHWPGNIRELQHAIERAIIMSESDVLNPSDFFFKSQEPSSGSNISLPNYHIEEAEKLLIIKAIGKHNGNITKAARDLGLTRASLYRRLEKYGL
ncbi:MAG TPA: sigma-54 dependent transcriptional regulator [Ignavibacteriaceae bacterium]|nr:sigma-54 dependent transcriptional regulator [Ignavibacteriaceae bacterium]